MARKSKARKSKTKRAAASRKPTTRSARSKKAPAAGKKGGRQRGTEVERRWAEYLKHRTALESAVEAVSVATEALRAAREVETTRRREFDESKRTLEQLLEVDAAQGIVPPRDRRPTDLPRHSGKPVREKGEERPVLPG